MCGIAGAVAVAPSARPDLDAVRTMCDRIAHRGPDGEGVWRSTDGRAVFGHRRLSVIDLELGAQPMASADGRYALVFNGEIYNYRELRAELERAGVAFRTRSDTEVLLHLLVREGETALARLRGMFAFALWDSVAHRLLIARDRVGEKPLYYTTRDGVLRFASALGALRASGGGRSALDVAALDAFLDLGYVPAPLTIYEDVRKLPAGSYLVVADGRVEIHRYWDLADHIGSWQGTRREADDHFGELFAQVVRRQLQSDVPLGVFLSGGVDSSLVAAVAAREAQDRVLTFSIGFDEGSADETPFAEAVAKHLGTEHRTFRARADLMELLPSMVRHYGEPFGDATALANWMLAERTREHVTVALGGDGGDEGFAGYEWYGTALRLQRLSRLAPAWAARAAHAASRLVPTQAGLVGRLRRASEAMSAADEAARFAHLRGFVADSDARALYAGPLLHARLERGREAARHIAGAYARCPGTPLQRMRYADISTYLADGLLPKVDVATMAYGLEGRAPLLDHEILEFALSLPSAWVHEPRSKAFLRDHLRRYLPAEIVDRPKHGFDVPFGTWVFGQARSAVMGLTDSPALMDTGFVSRRGVRALLDEHLAGTRDHAQRLYNLLVLDRWLALVA